MDKLEFIAKVRYLGWLCYQMGADLPLHDVAEDYKISDERLQSLMAGTKFVLEHPGTTAEENHNIWMEAKAAQGYVYGDVLDVKKKTHPSMVPFEELSDVEKKKDEMDVLMVRLANELFKELNNKEI